MWQQLWVIALQIWRDEASPWLRFKVIMMAILLVSFNAAVLGLLFFFSINYSYYLSNGTAKSLI